MFHSNTQSLTLKHISKFQSDEKDESIGNKNKNYIKTSVASNFKVFIGLTRSVVIGEIRI